jgi:hypothetical protein
MFSASTVTFYLPAHLRQQAKRGQHNFINKLSDVVKSARLRIAFDSDDDAARDRAAKRAGFGLFMQDGLDSERCLTISKAYIFPFWRIEKQADFWDLPIAQQRFDPQAVDPRKAANFYRLWQNRLHDMSAMDLRRDGFVFVALQGGLFDQDRAAMMDQISLIKAVLKHDPNRPVMATLDPNTAYSMDEHQALSDLLDQHDRLYIRTGDAVRYMKTCDYVVTQAPDQGFAALFFGKPVITACKTDFHHITLTPDAGDLAPCFAAVADHAPDYAAFLYWFLQINTINAGRPEAAQRIENVLRGHGWPV